MQKFITAFTVIVILAGCTGRNKLSDAYGNFETTEYLISAEGQGRVMALDIEEGSVLKGGEVVGYIDTMTLHLQKQQLEASIRAVEARKSVVQSQINVHTSRKSTLLKERSRLERLLEDGAATGKQLDDLNGQLDALEKQILSTQAQFETIRAEINTLRARIRISDEQLKKHIIVNPLDGTVLEKYTEAFEMAVPGKTLYKIADLGTMILRVYVSGDQLASLQLGQEVGVIIDDPAALDTPLRGRITWISGKSEFTPKIIQTREERVNLVYAVKVEVENDGRLKIGMPGEIVL